MDASSVGFAGIRELEERVELDWLLRELGPELLEEKVGRLGFDFLVGQVMLGGNRKNLVTPRLLQSFFIDETERIVAVKGFGGKADGRRFWILHVRRSKELEREAVPGQAQ